MKDKAINVVLNRSLELSLREWVYLLDSIKTWDHLREKVFDQLVIAKEIRRLRPEGGEAKA